LAVLSFGQDKPMRQLEMLEFLGATRRENCGSRLGREA
jgi:hypothetical protein